MGMLVSGLAAILLLLSRDSAAALFTSDPAVVQACSVLMLPLAALLLSECAGWELVGLLPACLPAPEMFCHPVLETKTKGTAEGHC